MKLIITLVMALSSFGAFAETITKIQNPTFGDTGLFFAFKSSGDGVCKHLGYDRELKGSKTHLYEQVSKKKGYYQSYYAQKFSTRKSGQGESLLLNEEGKVERKWSRAIGSIGCVSDQ